MTVPAPPRRPALDGLRGLAALVVVVCHATLVSPVFADAERGERPTLHDPEWWFTLTPLQVARSGTAAVIIFFVLSGLVLAMPAVAGRRQPWRSYYPQRLLRLYLPIAAAAVLALCLVHVVTRVPEEAASWWLGAHPATAGLRELVAAAIVDAPSQPLNSALWSLQWEVAFSVLLPAFLLLLRLPRHGQAAAALVLLLATPLGAVLGSGALRYLPVFGLGVLAAANLESLDRLGSRFDNASRRLRVAVTAVALVGLPTSLWATLTPLGHRSQQSGLVATVITAAVVVWLFACTRSGRVIGTHPTTAWLGLRSFSLYLVHEPIVVTTAYALGGGANPVPVLAIALPISLAVAELFGRLVEVPSHRLAKRVGAAVLAASSRTSTKGLPA